MAAPGQPRPNVGDILVVVHDFHARSSDELSLKKGDNVELIERDDEFGDGWFLGKQLDNDSTGLFPEVYTRLAPKSVPVAANTTQFTLSPPAETINEPKPPTDDRPSEPSALRPATEDFATPHVASQQPQPAAPVTLPLNAFKASAPTTGPSLSFPPKANSMGSHGRNQDSFVLHETLNVINEHITDLNLPQGNGSHRTNNDSSSEYSFHVDQRLSYIQGEETDEEEEVTHTRAEIESWSADAVAEYLFTVGVEKPHCEVFRDQEISGEVLLGMDQSSLFIDALNLGSVGRRLKTWHKIKSLQDEVNGLVPPTRRATENYGSDVGSDMAGRVRSRTNTIADSSPRHSPSETRSPKKSLSMSTPRADAAQPGTPVSLQIGLVDSPTRSVQHEKRPSAASVRDMHHSRRHSSTDFRNPATSPNPSVTPRLLASGIFPLGDASHKKQPSFDRNWTLGGATASCLRPQSSAGCQEPAAGADTGLQDSAVDLDRGYFSGPDSDAKRRNFLRRREGSQSTHSPRASYTEEQRVRSGTALSRHSRISSVDSVRDVASGLSPAAQIYFGLSSGPRKRTASTNTTDSHRPLPPLKDPAPAVTKLDGSPRASPKSPSTKKRLSRGIHPDTNVNMIKNGSFGLRAASDAISGMTSNERGKLAASHLDTNLKDSNICSPSRTGSSTPSAGPSFDLDSPDVAKSPSTTTTSTTRKNTGKKGKKETSAYTRGLQNTSPREAMADADYSGWMKKKSSNLMTTWKPRLFVLKGRRLAYYYSEDDEQEKGLIDISFHRVLPADNEKLTGLHATLTGAASSPAVPQGSSMQTLAATDAERDPTTEADQIFIFKLVPPRAGLSRAVTFTKPTVHYFAVPNIKQGRLWMAALMKATIDRDDTAPISTTYQQKTISLAKARQMRHRPPALMNLDEKMDDMMDENQDENENAVGETEGAEKEVDGLGIVFDAPDSGVSGMDKFGLQNLEAPRLRFFGNDKTNSLPSSA